MKDHRIPFTYRGEGNKVFVTFHAPDGTKEEEALCIVVKHSQPDWAGYLVTQLTFAEELRLAGLTRDEILAVARIYNSTKEKTSS